MCYLILVIDALESLCQVELNCIQHYSRRPFCSLKQLQLFILRAEAELQAVPEKNLSEALKCVDSLKQVVSKFFGGHVIKPIAFSLDMDNPQKSRDELFKPRGARNQMASSVKYKETG